MPRKIDELTLIDKAIAQKIDELRVARGLSNNQVAKQIGVTHQQFAKYTNGTNRISASRLAAIAKALNKPVAYFFDEPEIEPMPSQHRRMCMEVSRNFMRIKDPAHQFAVNQLVKTLAN
jgi:transcriptional regulator with XRE-family HTH domain